MSIYEKSKPTKKLSKRQSAYVRNPLTLDVQYKKQLEIFAKEKNPEKEKDYLLDNALLLYKYYDNNYTEDEIDDGKNILSFFSKSEETAEKICTKVKLHNVKDNINSLLDKYFASTDPNYVKSSSEEESQTEDYCPYCKTNSRILHSDDNLYYCEKCFAVDKYIIDHEKPSYKEPPKEISYLAYSRLNHLNETLNQIQGKETTDIPDEVYEYIYSELKKRRIKNMLDVTESILKSILKTYSDDKSSNKYSEHTPYILYKLTGIPPLQIPFEVENKIRYRFSCLDTPFNLFRPSKRKNLISYHYGIYKCLELDKEYKYMHRFTLLKDREKLQQCDEIWKKITKYLGWDFHETI